MKVLALIEAPNHVCYRYRLAAFAPTLFRRGWTLEPLPLAHGTMARTAQLRQAADADVVVLQRKLLPFWQLRMLRKNAKCLIYDFDDALFFRDWEARKSSTSWQRLAHFWATLYAADTVIAGNSYLQEQAASYVDPDKVHLIPTCIAPGRYPVAEHTRSGGDTRLVWIGQRSTLSSLEHAQPALAAAGAKLPGLELRVICDQFPTLDRVRIVERLWSEATEAADVADADVGISWLPDHPWSLGKCALKVLQYMAAGLPVVANPIGIHSRLVVHGETGYLADTPAEWAEAIERLANNPQLRHRMGHAARQRLINEHSVTRWAGEFSDLIESSPRLAQTRPDLEYALANSAAADPSLTSIRS